MPRVTHDDSTIPTKEKSNHTPQGSGHRGRRHAAPAVNGTALKESASLPVDTTSAAVNGNGNGHANVDVDGYNGATGLKWSQEDLTLLHAYRSVYRLETPSSFKNPISHLLLNQGIGKYSPTYARLKSQRRVSKDQLALAVRKNFNAMAVNEVDVIVDMLYKAKMKDKALRARFAPPRK